MSACVDGGHFFVRHLVGSKDHILMVCRRCGKIISAWGDAV